MKMGRERAVEDTDILPLKEENTTQVIFNYKSNSY